MKGRGGPFVCRRRWVDRLNPQFPSAGGSRMLIGHYLPMLVFGCLGQIVPEQVIAACGSPLWGMN